MSGAFDLSVFWPAFEAAGMLLECRYAPRGGGRVPRTIKVGLVQPDVEIISDVQSREYQMEYQSTDFPDLREGDQLAIKLEDGTWGQFQVREPPYIPDSAPDGFFRHAKLTRI